MKSGFARQALGFGLAVLGLALLTGCGKPKQMVKLDNYIITWYFSPRSPVVGENQVAVRIQDRDYRILQPSAGTLRLISGPDGEEQSVQLKPGPGRDLRGWVRFTRTGDHTMQFSFLSAQGRTITAEFFVPLPGAEQ